MRIPLFKRLVIACCNILFPPLAVLLICGPNEDLLFNCLMFLLAVIPSHVHGFYISLTYFTRKRRVRKGVYPGKPKHLIWSDKVNNGGASRREVEKLRRKKEMGTISRRRSRSSRRVPDRRRNRVQTWDDGHKECARSRSPGGFGHGRRDWSD
ncbi:hypothetical protein ABEF93_008101 [Exophiala dermatitidis]